MGSIELIYNDIYEELDRRALRPILLVVIIYIINEILTFYIDQKNMTCVNFWVLQIFFIHFLLFRKEKLKLYSHQKLLIVLRFYKSDKNIKENISIRANEDIEEISETEPFPIRDSLLDKNNEDKK